MLTLLLVTALCVALLASLWAWEAEREKRMELERYAANLRYALGKAEDELRTARTV